MQIDADTRLAAAAGGAARYFGDAAGLENDALTHLQAAIVTACIEAFEHLSRQHPRLEVTLTRMPVRIEIALLYEGDDAPSLGLDSIAGFVAPRDNQAGQSPGSTAVLEGIDRVQYESHGGVAVTRLTKYIAQHNARC
jgi:hypothetical protein